MELGIVSWTVPPHQRAVQCRASPQELCGLCPGRLQGHQLLTLNLGIRYDNIRPWVRQARQLLERAGTIVGCERPLRSTFTEPLATIVPDAPSPIYTRPGAPGLQLLWLVRPLTIFRARPTCPMRRPIHGTRPLQDPNNENFGPRIGINFALGTKTSIRAGYGIFYVIDTGNYEFDMGRNLGGKDGTTTVPNTANILALCALVAGGGKLFLRRQSINGNVNWTGPCVAAPQFQATKQNNRTPYVEQYILNVQRQLTKNVAIEVAYMGNESHHINRY